MSIFSKIKDAIFGASAQATSSGAPKPSQSSGAPSLRPASPSSPSSGASPQARAGSTTSPAAAGSATSSASNAEQTPVDVEASLGQLAATKTEKLNWRTSIVDLMKLLDIDSSLQNRKELAQELGYKGDMSDSANMNIWLHKRVMQELAAHGGKVPRELTD